MMGDVCYIYIYVTISILHVSTNPFEIWGTTQRWEKPHNGSWLIFPTGGMVELLGNVEHCRPFENQYYRV